LLLCLTELETEGIIDQFHIGFCGGHYAWRATTYKILRGGFYWPRLLLQVGAKVRGCFPCQMFAGKQKLAALPLVPSIVSTSFSQWGLYFVGEIHPTSSNQHRWILTATYYFTKWVEAIQVINATDSLVIKFIEENILSIFSCPTQIVIDNATTFSSAKMIDFFQKYQILLHHSTPYYPQGNSLSESSNKILVKVIKKALVDHNKSRDSHLIYAVWANRITPKRSTGKSPFQLVYGKDAIFPTNLAFPVLKFLQDSTDEPDDFSRRINQIVELNENRDEVQHKLKKYQNKMKALFNRRARERDLKEGDLVLRWDARREEKGKHGKFEKLWFGPLAIAEVKGNNTFVLQNLEGLYSTYPVNGRFLKHYIQY